MPAVSVIIPAFEAEPFIGRSVASVLRQSFEDWELLVVADDGTDYAAVLAGMGLSDSRIRCLSSGGVARGPNSARTTGLRASTGPIVAALDADDVFEPSYLARVVPAAHAHGACFTDIRYVDHETGEQLPNYDRDLPTGPTSLRDVLTSRVHTYANICFHRERVPCEWPAQVLRWEDAGFFVLCFDYLDSIDHIREPLYVYFRRQGSRCNTDNAASEFHFWTREVSAMLHDGRLPLRNAQSRKSFLKYLQCRKRIEEAFERGFAEGLYRDYLEYLGKNTQLFYTLEVDGLTPR